MKGYSVFQGPSITGTSPSDRLVSYPGLSLAGGVPLCRGAVSVFYSPSRLGNTKFNVKQLFQIIQFSISTQFRRQQFYFEQFSVALVRSLNVKTVLFEIIQFSINTQLKCKNQLSERNMVYSSI